MSAYNHLRIKYFHGVSAGNQHPYLLKSRYGTVRGFLIDVAATCDEAYRMSEIDRLTKDGKPVEDWLRAPLFSATEKLVLLADAAEGDAEQQKVYDKAQQKLGMGLSGFYALSEGLGMAAEDNPTNEGMRLRRDS